MMSDSKLMTWFISDCWDDNLKTFSLKRHQQSLKDNSAVRKWVSLCQWCWQRWFSWWQNVVCRSWKHRDH
jgi:hypothetical protein